MQAVAETAVQALAEPGTKTQEDFGLQGGVASVASNCSHLGFSPGGGLSGRKTKVNPDHGEKQKALFHNGLGSNCTAVGCS